MLGDMHIEIVARCILRHFYPHVSHFSLFIHL